MRLHNLVIFALVLLTGALAHAGTSYEAEATDTDLKTLVRRWANIEGKELVWQAEGNLPVKDTRALNHFAKLGQAKSFEAAFTRLNRELETAHNEGDRGGPAVTLIACVYSDVLVIQEVSQLPCSQSIRSVKITPKK